MSPLFAHHQHRRLLGECFRENPSPGGTSLYASLTPLRTPFSESIFRKTTSPPTTENRPSIDRLLPYPRPDGFDSRIAMFSHSHGLRDVRRWRSTCWFHRPLPILSNAAATPFLRPSHPLSWPSSRPFTLHPL